MEKINIRTLSPETQYELRKQVVRLKQAKRKGREISEITGLDQVQISRIWKQFDLGGLAEIKPKTRERRHGLNVF